MGLFCPCLSLRPVCSIHISCLAAREQTSAAQIAKASLPYNMKYFYSFLALSFNSILKFFLTEAAQYKCSYRRTAHHATGWKYVRQAVGRAPCRLVHPVADTWHLAIDCPAILAAFAQFLHLAHCWFIIPPPYVRGGSLSDTAICPSVCPSVCPMAQLP